MEVKEAQETKIVLERKIRELLAQFYLDTGLAVADIDIYKEPGYGGTPLYLVTVKVEF